MALLVDRDDHILLADPGYPCNRHFVRVLEGEPSAFRSGADTSYQLTAEPDRARTGRRARAAR